MRDGRSNVEVIVPGVRNSDARNLRPQDSVVLARLLHLLQKHVGELHRIGHANAQTVHDIDIELSDSRWPNYGVEKAVASWIPGDRIAVRPQPFPVCVVRGPDRSC